MPFVDKVKWQESVMLIKQYPLIKNIECLVCSYGGVGTSFLIEFINQYKSVNDYADRDKLKHLDRPPLCLNKNLKALYIYGNPYNAVISLFKRNYHSVQSSKCLKNYPKAKRIEPSCTLQQYLEEGKDRFYLESFLDNWSKAKVNYPIMLIKYETMWKYLPEIFDYLEIPRTEIEKFPRKIKRISDFSNIPDELKNKFFEIYGDLDSKINSFADIKIIEPQLPTASFLLKYYMCIFDHFVLDEFLVRNTLKFLNQNFPKLSSTLKHILRS